MIDMGDNCREERDQVVRDHARGLPGPVGVQGAKPEVEQPELATVVREEHRLLCLQLRQPDAYFIVTPVAVEAHLVRDHTGVVRE
jgi:hypothetical protein